MKVIIAGGRSLINYQFVLDAVKCSGFEITEVVSGRASGIDKLGEKYAYDNGIPISFFPANWDKYGKRAGGIRNEEMGHYGEALIAVWDKISRGTLHMIQTAEKLGIPVYIHYV